VSMDRLIVCSCGEVIVKSDVESTKVRSKILIFKSNQTLAVCKGCGAEVPIPAKIDKEELIVKSKTPRLFLRK
jgi:ribosomal protein S27E